MFQTLIYPSSGACDYSVELPHWSCCSWFDVCWSFGVVGLEWYPCCRLKPATQIPKLQHNTDGVSVWLGWSGIRVAGFSLQHGYRNSNTHRTKNNTTNVVFQQNSRKLLMMDILMSETCWAHMKWNKIASDIKLVFYSSTNKKCMLFLFFVVLADESLQVDLVYDTALWMCLQLLIERVMSRHSDDVSPQKIYMLYGGN